MYVVPDQSGRTAVVTGANSGTGLEAARRLAAAGAHVILAVRDAGKGDRAAAGLRARHPGSVEVRVLDLADLASVEKFVVGLADLPHVDLLLNNAGVMAPPERFETVDGFELQLGTNFLGPFALTNRLLPQLLAAPAPRVVTMSSVAAHWGRIRTHDLHWTTHYGPQRAYGQSKLADLYLARHLAAVADQRGWELLSAAAHPGFTRTNLQTAGASLGGRTPRRSLLDLPLVPVQDPPQGAEPMLFAATSPDAQRGAYYGPSGALSLVGPTGPAWLSRRMRDARAAAWLWDAAERMTGTGLPGR
ncbi:SDR family oxidoreductase [Cellulomonas edaphi]|uniref:SDR family oxidoreductase n=1 Tax=Cellulomonas edaphi TaxID=3053468 RepID=A0ABT7S343_9CELL|nr:SDR family oxidoreductase [Cellulomons edaphi]MDM7830041.1 SDR family oxidoreductase [Cellulomons edaphi]